MVKIFYDVQPTGFTNNDLKALKANGMKCITIISNENFISTVLSEILQQFMMRFDVIFRAKTDESVIKLFNDNINTPKSISNEKSSDLLGFQLPEFKCFLNQDNLDFILSNYNQVVSQQFFITDKDLLLWDFIEKPTYVYTAEDILNLAKHCKILINKSGDEDELEFIAESHVIDKIFKFLSNKILDSGIC